jgi:hypothetical protein
MDIGDLFPKENKLGYTHDTQQLKPERRPFYATDLLRIIHFEALLTGIAAFDLSEGRQISTADRKRLKTAFERINEAANYIN